MANEQKDGIKMRKHININTDNGTDSKQETQIEQDAKEEAHDMDEKEETQTKKDKGFFKLWLRTIWKMRSVYSGLAVHSFDVLTDILVIIQWLQLAKQPNDEHENIDPFIMALSAIVVLIASRVISTFAIFVKEGSVRRAILQFFDFLIFEEIYETHQKIVSQFKNKKSIQELDIAIESTMSFKYVRNFEAVFESIPQSVLQLVFIMRLPPGNNTNNKYDPIFIISIVQSVISMTNSILNNDYARMQEDRFKKYKQRFPPTFACFKHALSRLSEVIYRIGLLSLVWTVCGGIPFAIMLSIDFILIIGRMLIMMLDENEYRNIDTIFLQINSLIVIPSEDMYSWENDWHYWAGEKCCDGYGECISVTVFNMFCCVGIAVFITVLFKMCIDRKLQIDIGLVPISRISVSFVELMFLIFYGLYGENGENRIFLLSYDHGLSIFVATCISFFIFTQYLMLFPNFALPLNANLRSKYGYAFSNELSELKRIKVKFRAEPKRLFMQLPDRVGYGFDEANPKGIEYHITNAQEFWDEPCTKLYKKHTIKPATFIGTAATYALANEHYDIIEWLEKQGAQSHKGMEVKEARRLLNMKEDPIL
eukprot:632554_1